MKKFYILTQLFFLFGYLYITPVTAQLTATITGYESRCAATGAIKIVASGGSGSYQYKVTGPVNTNFTNEDSITGLSSGIYTVIVNDISTNATFTQSNIVVYGSYADPSFTLTHTDVSCDNGYNGSIAVNGFILNGRSPFVFTIVTPSPMGVGTSNSTGTFTDLKAGDYRIQMTDSCGGIQTRTVTINNYTWWIDTYDFTKTSCDHASGHISIKDSKGNDSRFVSIPGFSYGVVRSIGDTVWSPNGNFNNITITGLRAIDVFAKDICGNVKKVTLSLFLIPSVDASVNMNKSCNDFSASVTGVKNFFGADFYLYDVNNVQIDHNTTGVFNNIKYGSYCIKAHDACTDTTISRCFSAIAPVASVSNNVVISNKTCNSFTATITGQQNLTSPEYCVINSINGDTLSCNSTGIFNNLVTDGSYCIVTKDGCIDTTITRCFSVNKPIPKVNDPIVPAYVTCTNFGLNVDAQTDSLTNPVFCLYDVNHVLVGSCNNNGIFDSIPLGSYCVTIYDACRDTTITRCFEVGEPTIINDVNVSISNKNCTTFTATASSSNLKNPDFCLYRASDSSLIICNTTGVFNNLNYGDYYIKSTSACPDTTMLTSFSTARDLPSVDANVKITNKNCTTFTAQVTGQQNLISPTYCLINTVTNDTLGCSNNSKASGIPYGSYLIMIVSGCNDTLKVPFSESPDSISLNVTASKSCNLGHSKFTIKVNGVLPANIKIYAPGNNLIKDTVYSISNFSIDNLPALDSTDTYMVIGTDPCGNKDTVNIAPVVSYMISTPTVTSKCPGSVWPNGSGDINTMLSTNLSSISVKIINKNGSSVSINPDFVSGSNYSFVNLGPGTYVVRYRSNSGCTINTYDTLTITTYQYPSLSNSTAYQCDNNGFSVGAVASDGVGPFSYEIIGSTPSVPSLVAPPQSDPVFTVNNGTTYSLIRLRALDACGNATLGDVSILPLADNGIKSTLNCFSAPTTLSVDTIYNSSYSWFLKPNQSSADSVAVSNGFNYYIDDVLPTDTGVYVCHISVNNGCIKRTYYYHLDGSCFLVLPLSLENFSGKFVNENVLLNWKINNSNNDLRQIIVERKTNNDFVEIAYVSPSLQRGESTYQFIDKNPGLQNFYRLRLIKNDNSFSYSNIISVRREINSKIAVYPNPATDFININFYQSDRHTYKISLINILSQKVKEVIFNTEYGTMLQLKRPKDMSGGIYILHFKDINTNEEFSQKIILKPR